MSIQQEAAAKARAIIEADANARVDVVRKLADAANVFDADRAVADQHFAVTEKGDALYSKHQPAVLPASDEPTQMRKLRAEAH